MTALRQMGDKDLKELGIPMVKPYHSLQFERQVLHSAFHSILIVDSYY